jgi:CubicO group peptidase (beta-lactamase class C family)
MRGGTRRRRERTASARRPSGVATSQAVSRGGQAWLWALLVLLSSGAIGHAQAGLPHAPPEAVGMDSQILARIDEVMQDAIAARETPGGVVLVARRGQIVFEQAYGRRALEPKRERATVDTIYDLASLTKVVATTPAVLRLVEQGRLRLADRVGVYLPAWQQAVRDGKRPEPALRATCPTTADEPAPLFDPEAITLQHLLTHTSGLDDPSTSFFSALDAELPSGVGRAAVRRQLVTAIARRPLRFTPGTAFFYSDLNFLLLGEIVERVSGMPLDEFVGQEIFAPLSLRDTRFRPPRSWSERIAPTVWTGLQLFKSPRRQARRMLRAEASMQNVALLSGVAGHAGLFSTAADLAVFCQLLLDGGQAAGRRLLSPQTVAAMTRDQAQLSTGEQRGYGWDIRTSWSTPRGDLFAGGYGHTGWSGGSIWLIPDEELFIIVLTNRIHPRGRGSSSPLRGKIANVVAASLSPSPASAVRPSTSHPTTAAAPAEARSAAAAEATASKPTSPNSAPGL